MELKEFKKKIKTLCEKASMNICLDLPYVYDEDKEGDILITTDGKIYFADNNHNWILSHFNLNNVENVRYFSCYKDETALNRDAEDESYIYVNFSSGESFSTTKSHCDGSSSTSIYYKETSENTDIIAHLKENCSRLYTLSFWCKD